MSIRLTKKLRKLTDPLNKSSETNIINTPEKRLIEKVKLNNIFSSIDFLLYSLIIDNMLFLVTLCLKFVDIGSLETKVKLCAFLKIFVLVSIAVIQVYILTGFFKGRKEFVV